MQRLVFYRTGKRRAMSPKIYLKYLDNLKNVKKSILGEFKLLWAVLTVLYSKGMTPKFLFEKVLLASFGARVAIEIQFRKNFHGIGSECSRYSAEKSAPFVEFRVSRKSQFRCSERNGTERNSAKKLG